MTLSWLFNFFKKKSTFNEVTFDEDDYEWSQRLATQEDFDEWEAWASECMKDSDHVSHSPFRYPKDGKVYKVIRIKKEKKNV